LHATRSLIVTFMFNKNRTSRASAKLLGITFCITYNLNEHAKNILTIG